MLNSPYWDDRLMQEDNEKPHILAIGDSRFWYTLMLCQIASQATRP
jgi:hypothetical protein